ncbi:MAG: ABC-F family ATP-binding cassette domain-containing protein [Clostridiales bacterium]|nr:ABC-F family ATP-binding cassette domain-containing protein [Clostridiales bacterium]
MNILTLEKVSKGFGDKTLFEEVTFGIHEGDKIGIIGINGTGKSTLLKIIAGAEEPDEGNVIKGNGIRIGYLSQNPSFREGITVLDYVAGDSKQRMEDLTRESTAKTILTKLGIFDFEQSVDVLSGGQKKRIALAKILVDPAEILVLDEPTNHIDNEMADWLEQYLNQYKGVLVMVTHDRYFLDRVTNKIVEIDNKTLYSYEENYSGFLKLKAEREEMEQASYRKTQSILKTELAWMMRGARARSTKQKARIERFEELKQVERPKEDGKVQLDSVGTRLGKKTIELKDICKRYGEKTLIDHYSYIVLRDERIGIIGPNGCGKSTLIKIINGIVAPDSGTVEIGDTIKIGYFAQENQYMEEGQRVIDYIRNVAEYIETSKGTASASQMLERFLFPPAMQYTPVEKLSGGEKRRLYLLRVLMEAPNVLILDEPTNDLDIATLTILEDYLDSFSGIVITVSHDRYFLDRVVNRIFSFEGNGVIRQYEGGFSDYLQKKKANEREALSFKRDEKSVDSTEKKEWQKPKQQKLKFSYNEQREYDTIDEEIAKLEENIEKLEEEIAKNANHYTKLQQLMEEKEQAEQALEEKMERWVYLNDLAEKIEEQKQQIKRR